FTARSGWCRPPNMRKPTTAPLTATRQEAICGPPRRSPRVWDLLAAGPSGRPRPSGLRYLGRAGRPRETPKPNELSLHQTRGGSSGQTHERLEADLVEGDGGVSVAEVARPAAQEAVDALRGRLRRI